MINLMMFLSNSHSSLSEHSSAISAAKNAYNIAETYNIKSVKLTSLINYGSILLSANQEKDALYFLNKALSKYPDYQSKANIYNGFSCIYREHNKYTNAIEYAKKAVEYNVNFYLLKPTQLSELYETFGKVKDILDKERIISRVYHTEKSTDQLCNIIGCPHCFPYTEVGVRRKCPVCTKTIPAEGYLIARIFYHQNRKNHVHIIGCTECNKRKK